MNSRENHDIKSSRKCTASYFDKKRVLRGFNYPIVKYKLPNSNFPKLQVHYDVNLLETKFGCYIKDKTDPFPPIGYPSLPGDDYYSVKNNIYFLISNMI